MNIIFSKLLEQFPNVIESPFLIWEMLKMLCVGIKGESGIELRTFLKLIEPEMEITDRHLEELNLRYMLPANMEYTNGHIKTAANQRILTIANRIFIKSGTRLKGSFLETLQKQYSCGVQEVNFGERHQAADVINKWVRQATNERITGIISPNDVGVDTQTVLTNAIYFKAKWQHQFDPIDTRQREFYISAEQSLPVAMMNQTMTVLYGYLQEHQVQVIKLPYRNTDLAMLVMLPNEAADLAQVAQLKLCDVIDQLVFRKVDIHLPRFTFNCTVNVHNLLMECGVRGIFHANQDLNGILTENASNFGISNIIQQAYINVTEEGTEAAAATACCIDGVVSFEEQFIANRPFYFCIKNSHNLKLFEGCFRQPI
ncbi:serine protease inhibitor 42Dd [Ceratitis capitata]|uniref:serine protease inhibitor 42Dd n=1 Tax=Ceratitis capitata TaxID=7213 RepID=UPI000329D054|nr:serine protease inhibitor 42Dd [Ceratitis capitata]XP_020715517.1 serine protease inhibitor 42Dd [Ceratitis capitata]